MNIVDDFLDNPKRSIGGAVIPIIGTPGSGKTNVLIQLALMRKSEGHKVLWRGTEQGEWIKFLANDEKVVVWNHKTIDRVRVKRSDRQEVKKQLLEETPGVEVREWSDPETVVQESSQDKINVVNVPGLFGNGKDGRAFFTRQIINVLEEIIRRENTYNFVDFFTDEAGDIWPCQQQLSGEQYSLVAERTPPLLSQLRKQNAFLYAAAHGTQDMHYFVWKIKANTICYMSNSKVKKFHSEIKQKWVNQLGRGEMWVPPKSKEEYALAYEEEDLDWVNEQHVDLQIEDSLEEYLEDEEDEDENVDGRKKGNMSKSEAARKVWEENDDMTQEEAGEIFGVSDAAVARAG
jgi:hypothetical protein